MASKVLAERIKTALPSLIFSNQMTYLNDRFISEGVGLICLIYMRYLCDLSDLLKLKGLLLTVDIEKTFDSGNQNFPLKVLENYGFS